MESSDDSPEAKNIKCIVCGAMTGKQHLGIDACRACTIFYRRTKRKSEPYKCKFGRKAGCVIDRDDALSCKSCRFDIFLQALRDAKVRAEGRALAATVLPTPILSPVLTLSQSSSTRELPTIERLRKSYALMSRIRETSELCTRTTPGTMSEIVSGETVLIQANYEDSARTARVLISSLFDFASTAFDEFATFPQAIKWKIVRHLYDFICIFESTYRSLKHFPHQEDLFFMSYTTYLDVKSVDDFFTGAEGDLNEAKKLLQKTIGVDCVEARRSMEKLELSEEEFLTAIGLELWNIDILDFPDDVARVLETHRNALLQELNSFYKNTMKLDNFATRIGNLFQIAIVFKEAIPKCQEISEVYRLLDVLKEDTFIYQLSRTRAAL